MNLLSADDLELAERRLRYDNAKSPRLQKRPWAFVECLYCSRRRRSEDGSLVIIDVINFLVESVERRIYRIFCY